MNPYRENAEPRPIELEAKPEPKDRNNPHALQRLLKRERLDRSTAVEALKDIAYDMRAEATPAWLVDDLENVIALLEHGAPKRKIEPNGFRNGWRPR